MLPAPFATELLVVRFGVSVRGREAGSYSQTELDALRHAAGVLQRALPMPEANPPVTRNTKFAEHDSVRKLFTPSLSTSFDVTLQSDGRLVDIEPSRTPGRETADSLLAEGARLFGGSDSLSGVARTLGGKSAQLHVFTTARINQPGKQLSGVELPWYEVSTPVYRGTSVRMIPGTIGPAFPDELRRKREEGKVGTDFVVQVDSSVDKRSIRTRSSSDTEFAQTVRRWLGRARYVPGTIEGCPVSTHVGQEFMFRSALGPGRL